MDLTSLNGFLRKFMDYVEQENFRNMKNQENHQELTTRQSQTQNKFKPKHNLIAIKF